MKYRAMLRMEQVLAFCVHFYELESARMTKVEITPNRKHTGYNVVLTPEKVGADLLEKSFRGGLLNLWGWDKNFTKN